MANPNPNQLPQSSAGDSVRDWVKPSAEMGPGGEWLVPANGGRDAYDKMYHYTYTVISNPRNKTLTHMAGAVQGATPGMMTKLERAIQARHITTADDKQRFMNPQTTVRDTDENGNPITPTRGEYSPRWLEGKIDGKFQRAAGRAGKAALRSIKHALRMKDDHGHEHRHYTESTGLGRWTIDLDREDLPANYEVHPNLFTAEGLDQLNQIMDERIIAYAKGVGHKIDANEAEDIRDWVIAQYINERKNPEYPATEALHEMVTVQARIQRRRRQDEQRVVDVRALREKMQKDAKEAADRQDEANRVTITEAEQKKTDRVRAEERHTELLNKQQELIDKEDEILQQLIEISAAAQGIPDIKASIADFAKAWQKDKVAAGRSREKLAQANADMLYRLNGIHQNLRALRRDVSRGGTPPTNP